MTPVSGTVYTVTVNGIVGEGTLGLNVLVNGTIRDLVGNPLANPNGPAVLEPEVPVSAGNQPNSVALADLNGDGILDLVETNQQDGTVSVCFGYGTGTFGTPTTYAAGVQPISVAVADLNGDLKPDLVITNNDPTSHYLTILLGNGDGTFQSGTKVPLGFQPGPVTVADLTGNGREDLIVPDWTNGGFEVLLGNGDGSFQAPVHYAGGHVTSIAVADLNGNGVPDVIAADSADSVVSVYLGNGAGTFQNPVFYAVGTDPVSVQVGISTATASPISSSPTRAAIR